LGEVTTLSDLLQLMTLDQFHPMPLGLRGPKLTLPLAPCRLILFPNLIATRLAYPLSRLMSLRLGLQLQSLLLDPASQLMPRAAKGNWMGAAAKRGPWQALTSDQTLVHQASTCLCLTFLRLLQAHRIGSFHQLGEQERGQFQGEGARKRKTECNHHRHPAANQ